MRVRKLPMEGTVLAVEAADKSIAPPSQNLLVILGDAAGRAVEALAAAGAGDHRLIGGQVPELEHSFVVDGDEMVGAGRIDIQIFNGASVGICVQQERQVIRKHAVNTTFAGANEQFFAVRRDYY